MPAFYLFPRKNNVNHWFECFREFKYCKHHKHFLVDKQDVCYHKTKAEKCIFVVNISPVIFICLQNRFTLILVLGPQGDSSLSRRWGHFHTTTYCNCLSLLGLGHLSDYRKWKIRFKSSPVSFKSMQLQCGLHPCASTLVICWSVDSNGWMTSLQCDAHKSVVYMT